MKKIAVMLTAVSTFFMGVLADVNTGSSSLLPPAIQDFFDTFGKDGSGVAGFITGRAQFVIFLVLGLIILVAVIYSIMAGIKYIRSEGDTGKIEEAQKSIKAILMGIAAIFVAIVGIILVFVIFNQSPVDPSLPQVCLSAGGSVGCKKYYEDGSGGAANEYVAWCEAVYSFATDKFTTVVPKGTDMSQGNIEGAKNVTAPSGYTFVTGAGNGLYGDAIDLCIEPRNGGYIYKPN